MMSAISPACLISEITDVAFDCSFERMATKFKLP